MCYLYLFLSYGDRFTIGIPGRLFAGLWMIVGIILMIVMVGSIGTSLTTIIIDTSVTLYGTKVRLPCLTDY